MTSGITSGAETRPASSVLPRKRRKRVSATPARVFFDITLPIIAPALLSAWLLSFTLSLDDLVIASFVSGPGSNTLPMIIFSKIKLGVSPDINALATIIIGIVALGVVIATIAQLRRPQQRA